MGGTNMGGTNMHFMRFKTALISAMSLVSGCSLLIDSDRVQCTVNQDCTNLGLTTAVCQESVCVEPVIEDTQFDCRNMPFPEPSNTMVGFSMNVIKLVGQTPYQGLTVKACPQFDINCDSPTAQATSNAAGAFTIQLPEGFRGHLFAPPPASDPMLAPRIIQIFPPPSVGGNTGAGSFIFVAPLTTIDGIAQQVGGGLVAGAGHLFIAANDCEGKPLSGVTVTSLLQNESTEIFYIGANGQFDLSLTGTGPIGQAAIINVPKGVVTVRGIHESKGKIFEQAVQTEADTITSVSALIPSITP